MSGIDRDFASETAELEHSHTHAEQQAQESIFQDNSLRA